MSIPILRASLLPLALTAVARASQADVITGQVVDSNGAGVPGVNIDGFDSNGDPICLSNDGTNSGGFFTTTVEPGPGIYTFHFYPPAPPVTTHLAVAVEEVAVVGTTNMGTIALPAGVSLSGRAVKSGSIPVANVLLAVIDGPTGGPILLGDMETNALGQFNVAVPAHAIELQLDATTTGQALASKALELSPSGNTALGDILLPPGFTVTGHVQKTGGSPVAGADLDFVLVSSGDKAFTPHDNTDSSGDFSVVVAAGTYDIEVCPKAADALAANAYFDRVISGNVNVGTLTLQNGVVLSGTITDSVAAPLQGADVDVTNSSTGQAVILCGDNTDASGAYSVRIPTGTFDVTFSLPPLCTSGLGQDQHLGVVVNGNTVLNGMLPDAPTATSGTFAGDGINADTVAAVNAVPGSSWSAPLTIGHGHGGGGPLALKVRTSTFNGPNFPSPIGGRTTESLINGPELAKFTGSHNGATGDIAPLTIPGSSSLLGVSWAAQYTVVGGGFADFSQAVSGVIGCQ